MFSIGIDFKEDEISLKMHFVGIFILHSFFASRVNFGEVENRKDNMYEKNRKDNTP